jgi:hypothetical protein
MEENTRVDHERTLSAKRRSEQAKRDARLHYYLEMESRKMSCSIFSSTRWRNSSSTACPQATIPEKPTIAAGSKTRTFLLTFLLRNRWALS